MPPGVAVNDGWIYFCTLGNHNILRTKTPDDGASWETYSTRGVAGFDPMYYFEDGRLFLVSGGGESAITELDPKDFTEIRGTKHQVTPRYDSREKLAAAPFGLFQGIKEYEPAHTDWNQPDALDTARLIPTDPPRDGQFNTLSDHTSQEAGWLTKYQGKYYLQNSTPGTACPWYCDTVYTSGSINGPYTLADYAPASDESRRLHQQHRPQRRVSGFPRQLVARHDDVDRCLRGLRAAAGAVPAGFDAQGRMFTQTAFGDYPLVMPTGLRTPSTQSSLVGWSVLSKGKACTASSTLDDQHAPALAADENVRTWWSAKTGDAGEWFQMDLGKMARVNAVQVNFAEQDWTAGDAGDDYHAYRLLASTDGQTWTTLADKSANKTSVAHDYLPLEKPLPARYLKVVNVHMARHGRFALRDLRVFGDGSGKPPAPVSGFTVSRDPRTRATSLSDGSRSTVAMGTSSATGRPGRAPSYAPIPEPGGGQADGFLSEQGRALLLPDRLLQRQRRDRRHRDHRRAIIPPMPADEPLPSPRSAYDRTGGIVYFARMLDKIRQRAAGKLRPDYEENLGGAFDGRCCRFLGVTYPALTERTLAGGTDEEILAWCGEQGKLPNDEQILIWNKFMNKRGWRDEDDGSTQELEDYKAGSGLAHRPDIITFFDYLRCR